MSNKLILKASAGTGKTYRMSLEYIAALCRGEDYKSILVMTFTKKATSEIKERILKFLWEIIIDSKTGKDVVKNIKANHPDINPDKKKLEEIYNELVKNKDKLKIYTIDAFTNIIFKEAIAPVMNVYDYEMIDEEENNLILEKILEENGFDFMKSFVSNNLEKGIENYIGILRNLINDRWKYFLIDKREVENGKRPYENLPNLVEQVRGVLEILEEIANKKNKIVEQLFKKETQKFYFTEITEETYNLIVDNYKVFLSENIWNGNQTKGKDVEDLRESLLEEYESVRETLRKTVFNKEIIPFEKEIFNFTTHVYNLYDEIKKREKKFTFSDISNYTFMYLVDEKLNFVKDNKVTEDFYDIIGGKINTIFIDEFQDTSVLQWQILSKIINSSDNLLCVGDEKQSIYGWRGGEKKLFERLDKILDVKADNLGTCFRTEKIVTDYCNKIFEGFASKETNEWGFIPVLPKPGTTGGYFSHIKDMGEKTSLELMVENIEENFQGNYGEVGIIARTNKDLNLITSQLESKNIPYTVEAKSSIISNETIEGIYNLLRFLSLKEYLSLLNFLSMDYLRIDNSDMEYLINNNEQICNYLYDREIEENPLDNLSDYSRLLLEKIKLVKKDYEDRTIKNDLLIYKIIKEFAFVDEESKKNQMANLYRFIEVVKDYFYIEDFVKEFSLDSENEKFDGVLAKEENVVTLVTVHKSKGLEYNTVYYYHNPSKNNRPPSLEFLVEIDDNFTKIDRYLFIQGKHEKIIKELNEYKSLINTKELKELQEELNVLYVALTRPVNNLIVVFAKEEKEKGILESSAELAMDSIKSGPLNKGIPLVENESVTIENNIDNNNILIQELENRYEIISEKNILDEDILKNIDMELVPYRNTDIYKDDVKRVIGLVVHYFLENLNGLSPEEITYSKEKAYSLYGDMMDMEIIDKILSQNNIDKIINICQSKNVFDCWDGVYSEYIIFDEEEKEYRIDRLMVKNPTKELPGQLHVVDFKTGSHEDEQIQNYQNILGKTLEERGYKVKIYDIGQEKNNDNSYDYEITSDFIEIKL